MKKEKLQEKLKIMNVGEHFYSDRPATAFTYLKSHGFICKTQKLKCVDVEAIKIIYITKVTLIKKPKNENTN